ncbi:hypothetical protein [Methylomonas sp. HYX-M1]|uniref:hypothetical protein n=1 Tax=Methylomonas sp. HYX-M1 TaxID=3139307 RepID=UPI00345B9A06
MKNKEKILISTEKLTEEEFKEMIRKLSRYVESEMDQWEFWKFKASFGQIYVSVSMRPDAAEDAYIDLSHLIDTK